MIEYEIITSERFRKEYKSLTENEKQAVKRKVAIMRENPRHPSLRTKVYQGNTIEGKNTFEMSVNMNIRILWRYEGDKIILLFRIGHHDIL